ncbi:MAG TPA: 4Fe-4S binding protein [Candidatus Limnocylindrales bacterium]|nr:4Fe-4S binding protein [Candidatus Limnocylindrales bacterium]
MSTSLVDAPLRPLAASQPTFRPVVVAEERCKGCGLCVDVCQPHCLALDEGAVNAMGHHVVHLVDADACTSCAKCARVCPDAVLSIYAKPKEA